MTQEELFRKMLPETVVITPLEWGAAGGRYNLKVELKWGSMKLEFKRSYESLPTEADRELFYEEYRALMIMDSFQRRN